MLHVFFGPWRVVTDPTYFDAYLTQRVVISGSDNADGRYVHGESGLDLAVEGKEWMIGVEVFFQDALVWEERATSRQMMYLPQTGLTVRLERYSQGGSAQLLALRIDVTSLDPSINPPQRPNPYDFTFPENKKTNR